MNLPLLCAVSCVAVLAATSAEPFKLKRCEIIPLPENQASFRIDGVEKLRWHYGREYTRPFFYPFNGPAGVALTRMGHPGAQNHDHHKSVWLAHAKLNGNDYWSENGKTQVRQKLWYGYMDGDEEAIMGPGNDRLPPVDLVDVPEWLLVGLETQEGQPGIDDDILLEN